MGNIRKNGFSLSTETINVPIQEETEDEDDD
jgi:hypothetical protein